MKSDDYIETLTNYNNWFKYAKQQKFVADQILEKCILDPKFIKSLKSNKEAINDYTTLWINAHYHYGIGIENGFKGLIIKNKPDLLNFDEENQRLKNIGGGAGKSHNLLELGKVAGIFDSINIKTENNRYLEEVLSHLSDTIKWASRYPIPMNPNKLYKLKAGVPSTVVYGFHILDVIDPLFEKFEKEMTKGYV